MKNVSEILRHCRLASLLGAVSLVAGLAPVQASVLLDGELQRVDEVTAIGEDIAALAASGETWFRYTVAMEANNGMPCCMGDTDESICALDQRSNSWSSGGSQAGDSKVLDIYVQSEQREIKDIFLAGSECRIDAGGEQVYDFGQLSPSKSLQFLSTRLAGTDTSGRVAHTALAAIALHEGSAAQAVLQDLADNAGGEHQHDAVFWLGEARNEAGVQALQRILDDETRASAVHTQAVFALSVNGQTAALEKLIDLARRAPDTHIQSEAVFWLAESHPQMALETIDYVLANSRSSAVRKKAVFALSQLESELATPALIELIKASPDRAVRKEAFFWLGQNGDPQAMAYLEKVLTRGAN